MELLNFDRDYSHTEPYHPKSTIGEYTDEYCERYMYKDIHGRKCRIIFYPQSNKILRRRKEDDYWFGAGNLLLDVIQKPRKKLIIEETRILYQKILLLQEHLSPDVVRHLICSRLAS